MDNLFIIHALDHTTEFLSVFKNEFSDNYHPFTANEKSENEIIELLEGLPEDSIIVFLGHGHSTGLYTPEDSENYPKKIFLNTEIGEVLFKNKTVLLLSCNSSQFIHRLNSYKQIIGFGNIISSEEEITIEADSTGKWRDLDKKDIDSFNHMYCNAVIESLLLFKNETIIFSKIPQYIEFFINKEINNILKNKEKENRIEVARLLFEFRNDMRFAKL